METKESYVNNTIIVFSAIAKRSFSSLFSIPSRGESIRVLHAWVEKMASENGGLSNDRIVDYCVCQAYHISKIGSNYFDEKWNIKHSFAASGKSWDRFQNTSKQIKYYEDKWLKSNELSRHDLLKLIHNKSKHPLSHLIFPEYEESTKIRNVSTDVGYGICGASTLLYTPFSPSCQQCSESQLCIERTKKKFPELFRIRLESWSKKQNKHEAEQN